jgi:hypothetical protein
MAGTDTNGEAAPGSMEEPQVALYDKPAPQMRMAGTDCRFKRHLSRKKDGGMENFLLFILSSSVCALVASVTLLLRPLVGLP